MKRATSYVSAMVIRLSVGLGVGVGLGLLGANPVQAQSVTEFSIPQVGVPGGIVAGATNFLWFTTTGYVGRVGVAGGFATYQVNTSTGCSFVNAFFQQGQPEHIGTMTVGPDKAMWYILKDESMIGRVATDGTATRFPIGTASCNDLQLGGIATGADGNLWVTEGKTNKIAQVTPAGIVTEFAVPTASAGPKQITAGPDGNLWFTEANRNAIGRITPLGVITEFTTPGDPGEIIAGPDGNLWYANDVLQANVKIGRVTTAGVVTEFAVPASPGGQTVVGGMTTGPDGNIWFTETVQTTNANSSTPTIVGSKIGRITPVGVITEFGLPTATANPGQIASQAGALYFTETGDPALAFGGPAGSKIAKFSVPAYFPPVHVAAVFSTSQNTTQSYLRLYNSGTVGGTAKLTISDYTTGLAIASYTTPVIAPNTAPQIGMATLEAAATTAFTKPTYYTVTVEPQFTGSVAHVLYRPADGTLTNLSTCDRATTAGLQQVANVHTKFVGNNLFPSSIVVYNGALTATPVTLTVYDATTGNSLGTYTTASIPANGQVVVPVSTIEPNLNIPSGLLHYSVKVTSALTGYIQHLVNNTQPGVITDMSTVCALGASN